MSAPPEYTEDHDEERDHLLDTSKVPQGPDTAESSNTTYPPVAGRDNQDPDAPAVVYTYNPRLPRTGNEQRVMGILAKTKEDTALIVQSAIPLLADIPIDRIDFHHCSNPDADGVHQVWAKVMDNAWSSMVNAKPSRLVVTVRDGPGDAARRAQIHWCIALSILTVIALIFLVIWLLNR